MPSNLLRLALVIAAPLVLLVVGAYAVAAEEGMLFAILFASIVLAALFWFSDLIVVRLCNAELLTVYHDPPLFRMVEALSNEAGVPAPKVYAIVDDAMNALSIGKTPRSSGIVFTDGMRKQLPPDELRNVVAHELVHIKSGDALLGGIAAMIAAVFGLGAEAARQNTLQEKRDGSLMLQSGRFAVSGALFVLAPIAALFVRLLVDAKREFRADEAAAKLTGNPLAMANAIRTLEKRKHQTPLSVVPAVAHLFIVNPLRSGRVARLFLTHPAMEQRIARLEAMHRAAPASKAASLALPM
jgi:heat shock protein HtpX